VIKSILREDCAGAKKQERTTREGGCKRQKKDQTRSGQRGQSKKKKGAGIRANPA